MKICNYRKGDVVIKKGSGLIGKIIVLIDGALKVL